MAAKQKPPSAPAEVQRGKAFRAIAKWRCDEVGGFQGEPPVFRFGFIATRSRSDPFTDRITLIPSLRNQIGGQHVMSI